MIGCVIFAAGKGKRMRSVKTKILHPLMGKPMLEYLLETTSFCEKRVVVVGYQADEVAGLIGERAEIAIQKEPLGTADALACAIPQMANLSDILVLPADVPLIKRETLSSLINLHKKKNSLCTILSVRKKNPTGYGRVIITDRVRIVEEKDAKPSERKENLVNTGIYCLKTEGLSEKLKKIGRKNRQQEYYLTDIVEMFEKERVLVIEHEDEIEVSGINDRYELSKTEELLRKRG
ncbi:NTP transferase domain-containing protein [bacterium]|nr:NTP transferase domain-containing protein [bacterium]MBU1599744.1 NTP transferase domain-containing protein [bacterium]